MLKFGVRAALEKSHDLQNTEVFLKIAFFGLIGVRFMRLRIQR